MNDYFRVFEGTRVPVTFEDLLVPRGDDPDGLGPLNHRDRILFKTFVTACQGSPELFKLLCRDLFDHQKYQLKNSHIIADEKGEPADNMNIEDICPLLAKLKALAPNNPDHIFSEAKVASRYSVASWVFERCEMEGVFLQQIDPVRLWNDAGALETTAYPGDRAIDGDGHYPIIIEVKEPWQLDLEREMEIINRDLPPELQVGVKPERTQSRMFTDYQFQKGKSGNPRGRPRRPREKEDVDEQRPHFFDTLMPPGPDGKQITYGEEIYRRALNRALGERDWEWLRQMNSWAAELKQLRDRRPKFSNGGFVYNEQLEVTRIDIAIRHLDLAHVQWRKHPSARWVLKPWFVSAALERMKKGSLTREDMEAIYLRTRTPQLVDWPEWWPEDLRSKHSQNPKVVRPRRKVSGTIRKR